MNANDRKKVWFLKHGKAPARATVSELLKRTEGNIQYLYNQIHNMPYTIFASKLRDEGIAPTFKAYVATLEASEREKIIIHAL
jgi:hypothetical protein